MHTHSYYKRTTILLFVLMVAVLSLTRGVFAADHHTHDDTDQTQPQTQSQAQTQSPSDSPPVIAPVNSDPPAATQSAAVPASTQPTPPTDSSNDANNTTRTSVGPWKNSDGSQQQNVTIDPGVYADITPTVQPTPTSPAQTPVPTILTPSQFKSAVKPVVKKDTPQYINPIFVGTTTPPADYYASTGLSDHATKVLTYGAYVMALSGLILLFFKSKTVIAPSPRMRTFQV